MVGDIDLAVVAGATILIVQSLVMAVQMVRDIDPSVVARAITMAVRPPVLAVWGWRHRSNDSCWSHYSGSLTIGVGSTGGEDTDLTVIVGASIPAV